MSIDTPLGMEDLLVNTIAGNITIFTFLTVVIISMLGAKFNMPKSIYMIMLGLFAIMFSPYIGGIYLIVIFITGISVFLAIANLME